LHGDWNQKFTTGWQDINQCAYFKITSLFICIKKINCWNHFLQLHIVNDTSCRRSSKTPMGIVGRNRCTNLTNVKCPLCWSKTSLRFL
jgi:hypothetical protein